MNGTNSKQVKNKRIKVVRKNCLGENGVRNCKSFLSKSIWINPDLEVAGRDGTGKHLMRSDHKLFIIIKTNS